MVQYSTRRFYSRSTHCALAEWKGYRLHVFAGRYGVEITRVAARRPLPCAWFAHGFVQQTIWQAREQRSRQLSGALLVSIVDVSVLLC